MDNIPVGYCQCGCGQKTKPAPYSYQDRGWIKGKPTRFLFGHNGRIQHGDPIKRFWDAVQIRDKDQCWEWQGMKNNKGYGIFSTVYKGITGKIGAHRFSYLLTHGKLPPKGKLVTHTCDNPPCVNPNHLHAKTPKGNTQDMLKRGRFRIVNCKHPLSPDEVREIRSLYLQLTLKEIAAKFNTTFENVWYIVKRKTWKHIK